MDIFEATRNGDLEQLKSLLDSGVNIDSQNEYGDTALHYAVYNYCLYYNNDDTFCNTYMDIVNLLLDRGANPNIVDNYGYVPIRWAGKLKFLTHMIDYLKSKGAIVLMYIAKNKPNPLANINFVKNENSEPYTVEY
jgi:ankyrin repeat protein